MPPKITSTVPQKRHPAPDNDFADTIQKKQAPVSKDTPNLPESISTIISVKSPEHCDKDWLSIPEDIRNAVQIQDYFELPRLGALCEDLLSKILDRALNGFDPEPYIRQINLHGGAKEATHILLSHINPAIIQLQGRKVTRKLLDEVQKSQSSSSDQADSSRYMDFVTDDRNDEYFRPYVGQSFEPQKRIRQSHKRDIQENSHFSLHHFILWIGNGHRTAHFIRLWSLPRFNTDEKNNQWIKAKMNLLEALFRKAFQAHHGFMELPLDKDSRFDKVRSFGLNVMTPLAQSQPDLTSNTNRRTFTDLPGGSPDIQISYWSKVFRGDQAKSEAIAAEAKAKLRNQEVMMDIWDVLQTALHDEDLFLSLKNSMKTTVENTYTCPDLAEYPSFLGSFSAKIAFVIDANPYQNASSMDETQGKNKFPWALDQCGFGAQNSLLWTIESDQSQEFASKDFVPTKGNMAYRDRLLNYSNARVILVHGRRAEKVMDMSDPYILKLRGSEHNIHIVQSTGEISRRLLINCPRLPNQCWQKRDATNSQISEIFRWTSFALSMSGVWCYAMETSCVVKKIIRWAKMEKNGQRFEAHMQEDIELWLARKGISRAIFSEICALCGSFTRALLAILLSLSSKSPKRRGPRKDIRCPSLTPKSANHLSFGPEFGQVRDMITAISQQRTHDVAKEFSERGFNDLSTPEDYQTASIMQLGDILKPKGVNRLEPLGDITTTLLENSDSKYHDRNSESDLDLDIATLNQICKDSIPALLSSDYHRRECPPVQNWLKERDRFRDKEYFYQVDPNQHQVQTHVSYCTIAFSKFEDIGNGGIYVKIEIEMDKNEHPSYYALSASEDDPARKLAFRLRWTLLSGEEMQRYHRVPGMPSVFKANSFHDRLVHGLSLEQIAQKPRRWLITGPNSPHGLARFKAGGYTDGTPGIQDLNPSEGDLWPLFSLKGPSISTGDEK
ncbi:hypothetical protein N7456_012764 [Penicillium angulare]|uniref:Uncharacterized protein n=1 Tax=Penicillium angulare TaxID=116970 RepID=A0A9W9EK67_9EURO|nr:hypothetical protein N7456_012764 [Penicillium angulare]